MRLEGQVKMGYYPTPLMAVERIKTFITAAGEVSFFDPCCGEGLALESLASGFDAKTYGVELDNERARQAKAKLNHVLRCGYEQTVISNSAFSLLFLNPPYDFETNEGGNERKEKTFLKNTLKYLQPEGLLVYIIPQNRLDKAIARILASRFKDIRAYRFPDEEYEAFKQAVVFAVKKDSNVLSQESLASLLMIQHEDIDEIPSLDKALYGLPQTKEIKLFKPTVIDVAAMEQEVRASSLWQRIEDLSLSNEKRLERPPLPLHTGHLGLLLATGLMDGLVETENPEDRHIVKGKVEKVVSCTVEEREGCTEQKELDRYKVSIKVLRENGDIITLM